MKWHGHSETVKAYLLLAFILTIYWLAGMIEWWGRL